MMQWSLLKNFITKQNDGGNDMQTILDRLKNVLKNDERILAEGKLLKNKVIELTFKLDAQIIKLLLSDEKLKEFFFTEVEGVQVFDRRKFQLVVNNKTFLPDSYTAYKNKIGLIDEYRNFISEKGEVELVWAYKDCILEGGQTKEDQNRDEIFWNEALAPEHRDRLLEPKVITNVKKYTLEGEQDVAEINPDDNLIIKGNNLVALASLLKRFEGKIKCIYIDPPYNIGGDSFQYNDRFNHSSWLTFMKNRLQIAHKLLSEKGAIFIQIDHHELAYLSVLMDEIFGRNNKVQIIAVKTASTSGFKAVNPGPIDVTEYILFYTKNKSLFEFKKGYVEVDYHKNYNLYLEKNGTHNESKWCFIPIKEKAILAAGFNSEREIKERFGDAAKPFIEQLIAQFAFENSENIVSIRDLHKPTDKVKELQEQSRKNGNKIIAYDKVDGEKMYLYKGGALAFYSNKINEVDGKKVVTELLSDLWDHISWAGIAKEGGVKLKNGKKPEKLLKQIIELTTQENDIVLDFFAGSGTTPAVAHKMRRRYIGVEQMDYIEDITIKRLTNVVAGDQTGISKAVKWEKGGSFIYIEFKKLNQKYIDDIAAANTSEDLIEILKNMKESAFISYKVDVGTINEHISEFEELSIEDKKRFLVEVLDKNMLYVNYCDINDEDYDISGNEKLLNKSFYEGR